jgi:hypothetical protein
MLQKLTHWLYRYAPAEIGGTVSAYSAYFLFDYWLEMAIASAFIATWAENIGFYSVILWKRRKEKRLLLNVIIEFGPAELLDSFIFRPWCIAGSVYLMGPIAGVLVGKLLGDLLFYIPVVLTYENRGSITAR